MFDNVEDEVRRMIMGTEIFTNNRNASNFMNYIRENYSNVSTKLILNL